MGSVVRHRCITWKLIPVILFRVYCWRWCAVCMVGVAKQKRAGVIGLGLHLYQIVFDCMRKSRGAHALKDRNALLVWCCGTVALGLCERLERLE